MLWLGAAFGAVCTFITQVLLARSLEVNEYGSLMASLMMVAALPPIALFGIPQFWLKVFGKEKSAGFRWFLPSLTFFSLSSFFVLVGMILWSVWGPHDQVMKDILMILSVFFLGQAVVELLIGKFQIVENYYGVFWWQFIPHALRLFFVMLAVNLVPSAMVLSSVVWVYAIVALCILLFGVFSAKKTLTRPEVFMRNYNEDAQLVLRPRLLDVFYGSWPFGLMAIFNYIYFQSDIVLVNYIAGSEAAGYYSVSFSILAAIYLLPTVVYQKFLLPKLHRWSNYDRPRFVQAYYSGGTVMLALGVLAMIAIWVGADWGISFLFGEAYAEAAYLINVLAICIPFQFLASSTGAMLVTYENMKRKVICMGFVAVINIALNCVLIPWQGALGAAVSTVLSSILLFLIYYFLVRKYVLSEGF